VRRTIRGSYAVGSKYEVGYAEDLENSPEAEHEANDETYTAQQSETLSKIATHLGAFVTIKWLRLTV
jgi:hypothetical protein